MLNWDLIMGARWRTSCGMTGMQPQIIPLAISASLSQTLAVMISGVWGAKTDDQKASGINSYVRSCLPTILKVETERRILVIHALTEIRPASSRDFNDIAPLTICPSQK